MTDSHSHLNPYDLGKSAPPPGLGLGKPGQNEGSASIWCCIITSIVVVLAGGGGAAVYFLVIAPSLAEDVTFSAAAWVNEIDYDQVGADIAEFVEIGLDNTVVSNVSEVDVYVYLGQSQTFSLKTNLGSGETSNNSGSIVTARPVSVPVIIGGVTLYTIDYTNGDLENGPDGIAVVVDNVLQEFISYEGVFTALDGPAQGVTSVNWGVEDVNTEAGSLQLVGAGNKRTDFAFGPRTPPTKGAVNTGQSFV